MIDYVSIYTVDDYGIERPSMVRVETTDGNVRFVPLDDDLSAYVEPDEPRSTFTDEEEREAIDALVAEAMRHMNRAA